MDTEKRFFAKVKVTDTCWEWLGSKWRGYGRLTVNGIPKKAHRFMWEMTHGSIPSDMHVLHSCDNPACVNPAHLFLGTHQDNMKDKIKKGRSNKGAKNGHAKLTASDVAKIKELNGSITQKEISQIFSVSQVQISRIVTGKRWQ